MTGHYVTASRLNDGTVVWLTTQLTWSEQFEAAGCFESEAFPAALQTAEDAQAAREVIDVHAAPAPLTYREQIRAFGPSVRDDLGTQSQHMPRPVPLPSPPVSGHQPDFAGIYRYDDYDRDHLRVRVAVFREQVERRLGGALSEDEFKPLRLMNGVYLQLHGYMLRIALPYGVLSSGQLRQLAYIARHFDRGYGHFTTRQNMQFNWIRLEDTPDILDVLAKADMHSIQTSGNCVRNVTADHFAGAAAEEVVDPRLYAEILRQWSTDHPEFTYLPRKFKIAITGGPIDRAAIRFHDIGIQALRNADGEAGFSLYAGGGLGRTPAIGVKLRDWLPVRDLLRYVEAVLRTYNALGRRDNMYKARIKILIKDMKPENFVQMIEHELAGMPTDYNVLGPEIITALQARFTEPPFETLMDGSGDLKRQANSDPAFSNWLASNTHPHRKAGYISAVISLKAPGGIPGDISGDEMERVADLADRYSFGEIRVTHQQNLVLPHVRQIDLLDLWQNLVAAGLGTGNIGYLTDIISCPGLDYCSLATSRSIPVAQRIARHFAENGLERELGQLDLNVSGCINACGHHHVGHIGLQGVDKAGQEFYQITLGGNAGDQASVGSIIGPAVSSENIVNAVDAIVKTYLAHRVSDERFIDTLKRVGTTPFKEAAYAPR
ncbi:DUF2849 domain-containing protein [Acetobacter sp. DmW_136]|uniref:DUF2849 domain-containing protein n=1 Tax=Acetobacter sp. DmW_136 TaxID=2591091 RepID=UPI00123B523E|nr:DUF2849 domain-containing protein [Acetobacter sp. DmW_136]KAA8384087.1 DUF2849 domain-containing protein [Acetobacter sp. DmW_136]